MNYENIDYSQEATDVITNATSYAIYRRENPFFCLLLKQQLLN